MGGALPLLLPDLDQEIVKRIVTTLTGPQFGIDGDRNLRRTQL